VISPCLLGSQPSGTAMMKPAVAPLLAAGTVY